MSAVASSDSSGRVDFSRLWWAGPLAIVAAVVVNIIIQQIAAAVLQPDPQFMPLTIGVVSTFTVIGVLGAVLVYALIGRFSQRPIMLFRRVALIALVVSLIPDILMAFTGFIPGTTVPNVIVLMIMHVAAWAVAVGVLTRFARA
ncbi:MAG TPA: DUF6069 family protein [Roseiflexaceae bacterium]|nr:DUF6069 family protein [Roseiflexaceae bacterium]